MGCSSSSAKESKAAQPNGNISSGFTNVVCDVATEEINEQATSALVETGQGLQEAALEEASGLNEEILLEENVSLAIFAGSFPSASDFTENNALSILRGIMVGANFKLSMTAPLEFGMRIFFNAGVRFSKGTDIGDCLGELLKTDMSKMQDGVTKLLSKELKQASDQLKTLLFKLKYVLGIDDATNRKEELIHFKAAAVKCIDHAQGAFHTVDTLEEQTRSVEIAMMAFIATRPCHKSAEGIWIDVTQEVLKLLGLPRVLSDARHQVSLEYSSKALDFKEKRQARIRKVLMVVVHAEAFAVTNGLEPVLASAPDLEYPVAALLQSGVFHGKKTTEELANCGEDFTGKELSVIAGILGESYVVVDPDFLLSLEAAKEEQEVPDEATCKEAEEEEARKVREKAAAKKAAAAASAEAALTPSEQLALAEKKEDYAQCALLKPFVDHYHAAEAQLGVAKAAKDWAQAEKAKKLLEMTYDEWAIAEEQKAKDETAAREKVAAEKEAAEKAAAAAFAARPKSKPLGKELNTLLKDKSPSPGVTAEALDLISKDADLAVVDGVDNTPLHYAAARGHPDCVGPLLKAGAQLGAKNKIGATPLHFAACYGHLDCVGPLLKAGAQLEAKNKGGDTPLHMAAIEGHLDCVVPLLKAGAQVGAKDSNGYTPLHSAASGGHPDCVDLLLKAGAELGAKTKGGDTPLHMAAIEGHLDCVVPLLKAGAQVGAKDSNGYTPLHSAASGGHPDCVDLLVKAGAELGAKNDDGYTPLHSAANGGYADCVGPLLKAGAELGAKNDAGRTARDLAVENKQNQWEAVVKLLDEHAVRT